MTPTDMRRINRANHVERTARVTPTALVGHDCRSCWDSLQADDMVVECYMCKAITHVTCYTSNYSDPRNPSDNHQCKGRDNG